MAASDDFMTVNSSMHEDDDDEDDANDDDDQHHPLRSLSRLSMCTSYYDDDDDDDDDGRLHVDGDDKVTQVTHLSVESFEGEADREFSGGSSDSDKDTGGCFSLPTTPLGQGKLGEVREIKAYYCSQNELKCGRRSARNNRRGIRERWAERAKKYKAMDSINNNNKGIGGREWTMVTKPKGSRRSVCVDIDEIRACRDLGFELEQERMVFDMTRRHSTSTIEASSGGNSPIPTWRISSPGDDPRDVKARLRAWAQAVALASAACLNS